MRWTFLLLVSLSAELTLFVWIDFDEFVAHLHGNPHPEDIPGLLGAGFAVLAFVAALGVLHSSIVARRREERATQSLAADASTSPDWVWESDAQGRLTYSSHGVEALLGYRDDELLGVNMVELQVDDVDRAQAHEILAVAHRAKSGWTSHEFDWRHKDGRAVRLKGSAVALHDHKDQLVGFRGSRRLATPGVADQELAKAARARVSEVLRTRAFDIALQPIVDLTTGRLSGMEALARFHDGRSPDLWFRDARDAGQSLQLERATFEASVQLFDVVPTPMYLSINASPDLLIDPGFQHNLRECDLPLGRLVIEVTEHAQVLDYVELNAAIGSLRQDRVRIAIDDTGAGFASLTHVLELRPDVIKLDRGIVTQLDVDRARRSVITSMVLLALDIGATITAEGVETDRELDALRTLGVDHAQGYFLARPTVDRNEWRHWAGRLWLDPVEQLSGERAY